MDELGTGAAAGGGAVVVLLALIALGREMVRAYRHRQRGKEQILVSIREAEKAERIAGEQGAKEAVRVLGGVIDGMRDDLERRDEEYRRQRAEDAQRCADDISTQIALVRADLGADVAAVASRTRRMLPESDRTGRHQLRQIERRSHQSVPPGGEDPKSEK